MVARAVYRDSGEMGRGGEVVKSRVRLANIYVWRLCIEVQVGLKAYQLVLLSRLSPGVNSH